MRIPYNKTRRLSTAELPGVICDPVLTLEFVANPSFELVKDISVWIAAPEWEEAKRLAAQLITAVIIPDGERLELGSVGAIERLAEETEPAFIGNILNGWQTRISLERMAELKKSRN